MRGFVHTRMCLEPSTMEQHEASEESKIELNRI